MLYCTLYVDVALNSVTGQKSAVIDTSGVDHQKVKVNGDSQVHKECTVEEKGGRGEEEQCVVGKRVVNGKKEDEEEDGRIRKPARGQKRQRMMEEKGESEGEERVQESVVDLQDNMEVEEKQGDSKVKMGEAPPDTSVASILGNCNTPTKRQTGEEWSGGCGLVRSEWFVGSGLAGCGVGGA